MGDIVRFTDNYRDLSNDKGFQFEFICERCGNGHRSPFQEDMVEKGRGMLRSVGGLLGGRAGQFASTVSDFGANRSTNSEAKDRALREASETVADEFRQCRGCGNWVCAAVCWNTEIGQCLTCSPSVAEELSRAQAAAQVEQIQTKVREVDWTGEIDVTERAKVQCPQCQARVAGGKFCPECGTKLAQTAFCGNCGAERDASAKFCAECGTPAG